MLSNINIVDYFDPQPFLNPDSEIYNSYIYIIINNISKEYYVGKRSKPEFSKTYYGSGKIIKRQVKKYGKENFERYVIEWCKGENLILEEIKWIANLSANKVIYPDLGGLNLTNGGETAMTGLNHTEEYKKIRSEAVKGEKNPMYGTKRIMGEETRRKMRESAKNKEPISQETRNKLSEALKGEKNPMYGQHHTEETKLLIQSKLKDRVFTEEHKLNMSKNHADFSGENSPVNKWSYILSNGENFFSFYSKNEKIAIRDKFRRKNVDSIVYKGITITRTLNL